jgi:hypothetical protein
MSPSMSVSYILRLCHLFTSRGHLECSKTLLGFILSDMRQYWPKGIGVEKYMYIDPLALKGLEEGGLSSDPSRDAQTHNRIASEKDHPSLTAPASASLIAHSTGICQPRSPRLRHQHIAIITNPSEPRNPTIKSLTAVYY